MYRYLLRCFLLIIKVIGLWKTSRLEYEFSSKDKVALVIINICKKKKIDCV